MSADSTSPHLFRPSYFDSRPVQLWQRQFAPPFATRAGVISVRRVNRAPQSWLLPTAFVAYVALASASGSGQLVTWLVLLVPVVVAWGLKYIARRTEGGLLATAPEGVRSALIGLGLYLAAAAGPDDSAPLYATMGIALGLMTAGTLYCVARMAPPAGLLQGHKAARSLDALALALIIWTATTSAALLRAVAPSLYPVDPIALDSAFIFSALGSLLLLCASFLRARLLRGIELGVGDRSQAALSLAIAGTVVGAGSGFVRMATTDRIAGGTLVATCAGIVLCLAAPDASKVTRAVRSFLALLVVGTPVALAGAWLAMRLPNAPSAVALGIAVSGMGVGLLAHRVATPLGPEGSRWLFAIEKAMDAALHPEPELGIRAALTELRKAEPGSKSRPEIFRADPPGLLSVDIAGYLSDDPAEYPVGVETVAQDEPARTLRFETIVAAQVRKPEVRPLVTWFEAHRAKTATVMVDEVGAVGLLVLPRGKRTSSLSMEEAELLGKLSIRLAGLISVTASLRRARHRELEYRKLAQNADDKAEKLSQRLNEEHRSDRTEAVARAEILKAAAHSPAAQIKLQEIDEHCFSPCIELSTPLGVDPVPWAAHAHLRRSEAPRPLVVLDCAERTVRTSPPWPLNSETAPWKRAAEGTLVLISPGALPEESQLRLGEAFENQRPNFVVSCTTGSGALVPRLKRQLQGPIIALPTLADRAEDIQALVISELAQLGLSHRGSPFGIEKAALYRVIERHYPGNDAELKGLLASIAGHATGERITLSNLNAALGQVESDVPPDVLKVRTRSRRPPRAKRPF